MYSRGTCMGLRRVACAAESTVPKVSCTTGVAMGEPGAVQRVGNPNSNLPESKLRYTVLWRLGHPSVFRWREAIERGRSLETAASRATHHGRVRTVGACDKSFHHRERSLRWTKRWRRPDPVRGHDCDLRFSFPRSSRNLPFLSHDARVEMGRSAMEC